MRLKNFVTGASISDNTIQNCGIWDYQFARGEKNGEGIYIGTSSKQVAAVGPSFDFRTHFLLHGSLSFPDKLSVQSDEVK